MFTGIVREKGTVRAIEAVRGGARISLDCREVLDGLRAGDSVNVNGVCLTAEALGEGFFWLTAAPETLRRSNLGSLERGDAVNLEPALRASDFMGGHLVQGHVDGTGEVESIRQEGDSRVFRFKAGREVLDHCVFKGSVAVDGVSLTVAGLDEGGFAAAVIPHTYRVTTFSNLGPGDTVNLEADVISKYVQSHVERILENRPVGGPSGR